MNDLLQWIESHPQAVELLKWLSIALLAWLTGMFRWILIKLRPPYLEIIPQASCVFFEELGNFNGNANTCRSSFIIHASIVNRSTERIVVDRFKLGYQSFNFFISMRQKLLRIAFPSWPRKKLGEGYKYMGVFFTKYGDEQDSILSVSGTIESRELASGYLLFVSATHGSWNPKVCNSTVKVRLSCKLTTGETLNSISKLRVTTDRDFVEDTCPGLINHVADESTWNHSIG